MTICEGKIRIENQWWIRDMRNSRCWSQRKVNKGRVLPSRYTFLEKEPRIAFQGGKNIERTNIGRAAPCTAVHAAQEASTFDENFQHFMGVRGAETGAISIGWK